MSSRDDSVELRIVVPREQLPMASPPDYYSQVNCHLLGLPKRQFLELLRRDDAPPSARVGKLRLVARARMLEFIDRLREIAPKAAVAEMDEADRLLLEMGCAPTRGRKAG